MKQRGMKEDSDIPDKMCKYFLFRLLSVFMPYVPFYITDYLSIIIGTLIYKTGNWRIKAIEYNLRIINIEHFNTKNIFINMTINYFDIIRFVYKDSKYLQKITLYTGDKDIPNQFMLLTGHFGNWDVAGVYISAAFKKYNVKFITVAESKGVGRMFEFLKKLRAKENMEVLKLEDKAISFLLLDALREGYSPVFLIDRDIMNNGMLVKFGNRNAYIPKGPYVFAKRFNMPVYIGVLFRIKHKRYRYKVLLNRVQLTDNVNDNANICIDAFINCIKIKPEEWFAFDINWEEK